MTKQGTPLYLLLALLGSSPAALGCAAATDDPYPALGESAQAVISDGEPPLPAPSGNHPDVISLNGFSGTFAQGPVFLRLLHGVKARSLSAASGSLAANVSSSGANRGSLLQAMAYLTYCALRNDQTLVIPNQLNGGSYAFKGGHGLAPAWYADRALSGDEQRWVSACLLAHMNSQGKQVAISLRGPRFPAAPEEERAYGEQEAAYFGDLFLDAPERFACRGTSTSVLFEGQGRTCHLDEEACGLTLLGSCKDRCREDRDTYGDCRGTAPSSGPYGEVVTVNTASPPKSSPDNVPTGEVDPIGGAPAGETAPIGVADPDPRLD
ncbi:hypothetical protein [Sorangium sp. So ce131]|uniref:hypothetical protein n=1 Tax=Sorangium sp. So ce131 TaxID=3133282 RepID=UPI003F6177B0